MRRSPPTRLEPDLALVYLNKAIAHAANGDDRQAIVEASNAIRMRVEFADAFYVRGAAKAKRGDDDGAIADYSMALSFDPTHRAAKSRLAAHSRETD